MNHKLLSTVSLIAVLAVTLLSSAGHIQAQASQPVQPAGQQTPAQADSPQTNALGQPEISFRYVKTLGTTGEPYLTDTTHLNHPTGLFIDSSDNLYVVESQGHRILKYNSAGANVLSIGKAGSSAAGNYRLGNLYDIALDGGGNMWVTGGSSIVQFSPTGTFLQELQLFRTAFGIAIDNANHRLFVADGLFNIVQVYDNSGSTPVYSATIGVNNVSGSDNSHFNYPGRLALDSDHNLYVVDNNNNRVQKCVFGAAWTCSTFTAVSGQPQGITIDSSNNVYITDTANGRILKCTPEASCATFEQDAFLAYDVAVDSNGNVYGAVENNAFVSQYNSSGSYQGAFVGVPSVPYLTDGNHFNQPRVAIDKDDNIIVLESGVHRLTKLNPQGGLQWSFIVPGEDMENAALNRYSPGVGVDKDGKVYVASGCNVQIYSPAGVLLNTLGAGCGDGNYQFSMTLGVAVDGDGKIYVADFWNNRVQIYNSALVFIGKIGVTRGCSNANDNLCNPIAVAIDSSKNIYIRNGQNSRIQKFDSLLNWQMTIDGENGNGFGQFATSWGGIGGIALDKFGRIYVPDTGNNRVQVFGPQGAFLATIGGAFSRADGVAVDSQGNVYATDNTNATIQKFALGVPGWRQINFGGFGQISDQVLAQEVFNNQLYAATSNWSGSGGRIYRRSAGTDWTQVSPPGFGEGGAVTAILDMAVFKGKLYATTGWGNNNSAVRIYRTDNGTSWNPVVSNGFGNTNNVAITVLAEYKDQLYAVVSNRNEGVEIWRSTTGDSSDWSRVVSGGFDDAHNISNQNIVVFNGGLYTNVENSVSGFEVWKTSNGTTWEQVSTDGFGNTNNNGWANLQVFNNQLYVSGGNSTLGVQLWRSSNGANWEKVVGDGFGSPNNTSVAFFVYNGSLYALTNNNQTGVQIWRSMDGATWLKAGSDGLGNSSNGLWWNNASTIFNGLPVLGTSNWSSGGEVWQMHPQVFLPLVSKP